ncbi:hydroxylase [Rhodococcus sp. AD45-ID]|uniref:acyl-CoA dehydrogenase family protein n=1 Tax=unclassified Rhodococcus (in: high G+C Gram-positive bacteria) TaxID=192944 RepID=UPI0005D3B99E|nr:MULTISPECIES: acyl-CoA dehydrogenase family protein [unclassified Rhodococcus (in: high G+C Gram-positive bacteria)]KJF24285.1 Flavin-dependent monooxygenase, oxygenase subunit HsaA [Rhodococcus sp. AD45]NRI69210.1 hydroxylase [Rhodococcus sp. MS16]PSR42600.1 hydroxylase [Rhodococcus sp. AD45-ID]
MSHQVLDNIVALADDLRARAEEAESLGRLPDDMAKGLKSSGIIRMLARKEYDGFEAHPRDFSEAVMKTASVYGSAGWVAGIVGVHPWQLAMADPKVQQEVLGSDSDTWQASPYMPGGVATPVDGGYIVSGRWQFSSGTDHCDWIFLGAMIGDKNGAPLMPPQGLHVILPRSDYEIVEDSWDVVGLRGTGSKDIIVTNQFIPSYRVMDAGKVIDGTAAQEYGVTETLYKMPWSTMFPLGITSATIGIAEGVLAAGIAYQRERVGATGAAIKDDPYTLHALGEAASEIDASRQQLLSQVDRIFDKVDAGQTISFEERALVRRNQTRAAWRAVRAADEIFDRSGGNALRNDNPLQRFWRDAHAGLHHAIHVSSIPYHSSALSSLGAEPQGTLRIMI